MKLKRKPILFILVAVVVVVLLAWLLMGYLKPTKKAAAKKLPTVKLATVKIKTIPEVLHAIGRVVAPQTTILKNQIAGTVTDIYFKSGDSVQEGQLLVQIDPSKAKALVAQRYADYVNLKTEYDRFLKLSKLSKGADISADKLSQAKNNTLAAKAEWEAAKRQLADTQIRAPFSGIIGMPQATLNQLSVGGRVNTEALPLTVGTYLPINSSIAILSNDKNIIVQYQIPASFRAKLKLGQTVKVKFAAYPKEIFKGKVFYISPIVYAGTQTYIVRARIFNKKDLLQTGINAQIVQIINPNRKILAIPGLALVPSLSGYSVYIIENSKVRAIPVKIGERFNGSVAIKSGLKANQKIIANGALNVHPGMKVKASHL